MAEKIVHSAQETFESLQTILNDEPTFQKVVDAVFGNMDMNGNGVLDPTELAIFMVRDQVLSMRGYR